MLVERQDGTFMLSTYDGEHSRILDREEGVELAMGGKHDMAIVDPALIILLNNLGLNKK